MNKDSKVVDIKTGASSTAASGPRSDPSTSSAQSDTATTSKSREDNYILAISQLTDTINTLKNSDSGSGSSDDKWIFAIIFACLGGLLLLVIALGGAFHFESKAIRKELSDNQEEIVRTINDNQKEIRGILESHRKEQDSRIKDLEKENSKSK